MRVTAGDEADVLGTDAPEPARRSSRALVAAVCATAAVAAGGVVALQRLGPVTADAAEVFGTMSFDSIDSRTVESPSASRQERDGTAIGSIELELPDRTLAGEARLDFAASLETVDGRDVVTHAWGDVRLRFDAVSCRGAFGWTNVVEPLEGGGSLHVRCEDGATLMAQLVATPQPQVGGVVVDLEDGWWTSGT